MSKIAKKPIIIPEGVTVSVNSGAVECSGKLGKISVPMLPFISVAMKDRELTVRPNEESNQAGANWGTMASLIMSALKGVNEGFTKTLEIEGIGFRATMEGETLVLNIGFTHPVKFQSRQGVKITVAKNIITIAGIDKALVGQTAAHIRSLKKPEPYKGKGIKYSGEVVRRKAGKKVAGAGSEQK
ncbi:MAG: 50S ribosomal protein L6 [Patescibacteria group bacterium]